MLSVKLLDDYLIKSQDIKTFKIQLLRDGLPNAIPAGCTVKLLIANGKSIVKQETMKVVSAEEGIVEFTLKATIGVGNFDCEFVLSNGNDINLTFPDNGYTVLKVSPCLTERPVEQVTPTEWEALNERMDGLVIELETFESEVQLLLAEYEQSFEDMETLLADTYTSTDVDNLWNSL